MRKTNISGNFLILLEQRFCRTLVNSFLCMLIYYLLISELNLVIRSGGGFFGPFILF